MAPAEKSKVFDLKYQLLQYGSHHHNVWNVGIHLTCIPLILWSALVGAATSGPLIAAPSASAVASGAPLAVGLSKLYEFCPPNAALLTMVAYVSYYTSLDKVAGVSFFTRVIYILLLILYCFAFSFFFTAISC